MASKVSKGAHWFLLFIDKNTALYFDSFGIGYTPQDISNKIKVNQLLVTY